MRLGREESRRRRLRLIKTRNHLRNEARRFRSSVGDRQSDLHIRHQKLLDIDRRFVGRLAAGDSAIGHFAHVVATVHGHFSFGVRALVMVPGNGAVISHTAAHSARDPGRARKRSLQQHDGDKANYCREFASHSTGLFSMTHCSLLTATLLAYARRIGCARGPQP